VVVQQFRFYLLLAMLLIPAGVRAQPEIIDRVVAVVNDEAIFESDVDQAVRQYFFQRGQTSVTPAERDEVFKDALDNLINDKLVIAQAGRLGIDVPFSEVEAQVQKASDENARTLGVKRRSRDNSRPRGCRSSS
jgi:peptidyl-prolyl cis-trans isomerase SurA